ncbi:MAG: hypothetical protein ACOCZ7_02100 [Armatimonadota bacterium]
MPLIFCVPRAAPREVDAICEMTDLYATLMDLVGLKPRNDQFSESLLPAIEGDEFAGRDAVFSEGGRLSGEEHWGISMHTATAPGVRRESRPTGRRPS